LVNLVSKITLLLCGLACYFPYIVVGSATESDLQPAALICGLLFVCISTPNLSRVSRPKIEWVTLILLFIPACYALAKLALDSSFTTRSAAYYLSLPVFFIVGSELLRRNLLTPTILFTVSIIWLSSGLIQKYFDPTFGYGLMHAPRTTPNRGVVSLAAEPSFYAIQCLMLMMANSLTTRKTSGLTRKAFNLSTLTELILIFQIIFLARSFFGVLLLLIFLLVRMFISIPFKAAFLSLIFLLVFGVTGQDLSDLVLQKLPEGRIFSLISRASKEPLDILITDQSAGERLTDIVLSFYSFAEEPILNPGRGTLDWRSYVAEHMGNFDYLNFSAGGERIMSGLGAAAFELGTIGCLILLAFLLPLVTFDKRAQVIMLALILSLLAAIQLSLPLVGVLVGATLVSRRQRSPLYAE